MAEVGTDNIDRLVIDSFYARIQGSFNKLLCADNCADTSTIIDEEDKEENRELIQTSHVDTKIEHRDGISQTNKMEENLHGRGENLDSQVIEMEGNVISQEIDCRASNVEENKSRDFDDTETVKSKVGSLHFDALIKKSRDKELMLKIYSSIPPDLVSTNVVPATIDIAQSILNAGGTVNVVMATVEKVLSLKFKSDNNRFWYPKCGTRKLAVDASYAVLSNGGTVEVATAAATACSRSYGYRRRITPDTGKKVDVKVKELFVERTETRLEEKNCNGGGNVSSYDCSVSEDFIDKVDRNVSLLSEMSKNETESSLEGICSNVDEAHLRLQNIVDEFMETPKGEKKDIAQSVEKPRHDLSFLGASDNYPGMQFNSISHSFDTLDDEIRKERYIPDSSFQGIETIRGQEVRESDDQMYEAAAEGIEDMNRLIWGVVPDTNLLMCNSFDVSLFDDLKCGTSEERCFDSIEQSRSVEDVDLNGTNDMHVNGARDYIEICRTE